MHICRPPTQAPINPPYKEAVDMKKQNQLAKPEGHNIPDIEALNLCDE